jgi:hypothetical protein
MNAGRFVSSYVADAREYSLDRRNICSAWHRTWRHFRANANQVTSNILKLPPSDYTEYLGVHQSYLITYRFVPEGRLCQRALYGASIAHEIGRRRKKGKGPGQLALQHRSSWILMPLGPGAALLHGGEYGCRAQVGYPTGMALRHHAAIQEGLEDIEGVVFVPLGQGESGSLGPTSRVVEEPGRSYDWAWILRRPRAGDW